MDIPGEKVDTWKIEGIEGDGEGKRQRGASMGDLMPLCKRDSGLH